MKIVPPGGVIGILGGGQLGRMLAMAAARLGLDAHVYAPDDDSPAARVSALSVAGAYDDAEKLSAFAKACDVVTFEFENVPAAALDIIAAAGAPAFPSARALAVSQDRVDEKSFLESVGVKAAPFVAISGPEDIAPALERLGGKAVLKSRRQGYDGRGQARIDDPADAKAAWDAIGCVPAILEAWMPFEREISVIVVRAQDGEMLIYDIPHNDHAGGILRSSTVPSGAGESVEASARAAGERLAAALDYVGVMALELFVMPDGSVLANEFAPRVHNSGHWTEDACKTGQFEQHVRAVCGWPLGPIDRHSDVSMINLLGDCDVARWADLAEDGATVRLYGKRGGGELRKLGHATKLSPRR